MTDRLKKKLRSSQGASITFALLLFLVCAVIGSVVLAAGTASSGRFSKLADSDARYYSVTSAANLLKDEIAGRTFKMVHTVTERYAEDIKPDGEPVENSKHSLPLFPGSTDSQSISTEYYGSDGNVFETTSTLPSNIDSLLYQIVTNYGSTDVIYEYSLNLTPIPGDSSPSRSVSVKESVSENGNVSFTISSGETGEEFTVEVLFEADVTQSVSSSTVENGITISSLDPNNKTVDKTVTQTTVTTFEWTLSDIRRIAGS